MPLPTVILPGYLASAQPYKEMEAALAKYGFPAVTVPLRRRDWLTTVGGRSVIDIIQALDATAQQAMNEHGCNKINLIGHSAGGWISRIYLGESPYDVHVSDLNRTLPRPARSHVKTLLTLGTPHRSEERWTKRYLDFVNNTYPGAFYDDVKYVCIAGKSIMGKKADWFTFNSYRLTVGQGDVWGDGVVPVAAANLEGAHNITLEEDVHSPRKDADWYGLSSVVEQWQCWLD